MRITILLRIPGEPVAQGRARVSVRNGIVTVYDPPESRKYKQKVNVFAKQHYGWDPIEGAVGVKVDIFRSIPASWSEKKKRLARERKILPVTKPDSKNYYSLIEDALNKVCYVDDSQVQTFTVSKWYSDEPRVEIEVYGIEIDEPRTDEVTEI